LHTLFNNVARITCTHHLYIQLLKLSPDRVSDTGWGDIGANFDDAAAGSPSETPHINALARDGMRFTDGHAGASVCGPSRSAIMTGRLGIRNGITHNSGYKWLAGLPRSELTLGEMMKSGGYDTLMLGK
jgi:arylsulfatase G